MNKKINIGTDCSGIEAPLEALRQLKIPFVQKFSSEIDLNCIKTSRANFPKPVKSYRDITERNHKELKDLDLDIYIAGFPCQPFSLAGKKEGTLDPRSNILYHCISTIKYSRPKIFILENVKNFMNIEKSKPFFETIEKLKSLNNEEYNVEYRILNTKDYGIPQNRERLFIYGIRKDIQSCEFKDPQMKKLEDISDYIFSQKKENSQVPSGVIKNYEKNKHKIDTDKQIIISTGGFGTASNISPALTRYRHYLFNEKRYLSGREALNLQGFSKKFKIPVSEGHIYSQAGNSMSVNVLKVLFLSLLDCCK